MSLKQFTEDIAKEFIKNGVGKTYTTRKLGKYYELGTDGGVVVKIIDSRTLDDNDITVIADSIMGRELLYGTYDLSETGLVKSIVNSIKNELYRFK